MDEKARHQKLLEMEHNKAGARCFELQVAAHDAFWDMLRAKYRMINGLQLDDPCSDEKFFKWAEGEESDDPARSP